MSKTKRRIRRAIMAGAALYGANKLMGAMGPQTKTGNLSTKRELQIMKNAKPKYQAKSDIMKLGKTISGSPQMAVGVDRDASPFERSQIAKKYEAGLKKSREDVAKRIKEGKVSPLMPKTKSQIGAMFNNEGFGLSAKKGKMIKASQGYNARLDESLGMRNKNKSQTFKARRDESKGMEKAMGKGAYSGASTMAKKGKMIKARGGVMVRTKLNGDLYTETF